MSGSKGIQIYLPLNTDASYAATQPFARAMAELLERKHGDLVVSDMAKNLRVGKVFIDWSQNDDHKTTIGGTRYVRNDHAHTCQCRWNGKS